MPLPFWAEWAGLAATLIALGVTVWQSVRARRASELARAEVLRFRRVLDRHDLASRLGAAVEALDEIRKQVDVESPRILLDRCARLRRALAELATASSLSDNDRKETSAAQSQIATLSNRLADAQARPLEAIEKGVIGKAVMKVIDRLSRLLGRMKGQIGEH